MSNYGRGRIEQNMVGRGRRGKLIVRLIQGIIRFINDLCIRLIDCIIRLMTPLGYGP